LTLKGANASLWNQEMCSQASDGDGSGGPEMDSKRFEYHAAQLFLTYSQVPLELSKEDLLEHLREVFPSMDVCWIGLELHRDGGHHFHAYLHFAPKLHARDSAVADIEVGGVSYHPNWSSVKSSQAVKTYVKKDGDYLIWPPDADPGEAPKSAKQVGKRCIELAVDGKVDEAIKYLREFDSGRWLVHGSSMEANLRRIAPSMEHPEFELDDFVNVPYEVERWRDCEALTHSLVLVGESGWGKTALAKVLLGSGYVFVRHMDALKRHDLMSPYVSGIIFDDMSFRHWSCDHVKHLVDVAEESHINVKHSIAVIPKGLPRIFTANRADIFACGDATQADAVAIDRRIRVVVLDESLVPDPPAAQGSDVELHNDPLIYADSQ